MYKMLEHVIYKLFNLYHFVLVHIYDVLLFSTRVLGRQLLEFILEELVNSRVNSCQQKLQLFKKGKWNIRIKIC